MSNSLNGKKVSVQRTRPFYYTLSTFLYHPISRHSFTIICIIFQDENGKKYYNILNDDIMNSISDVERKKLKEKLSNAKVSLLCYENTNFIISYQLNKIFEI